MDSRAILPSSVCLRILFRARRGRCYTGILFPRSWGGEVDNPVLATPSPAS